MQPEPTVKEIGFGEAFFSTVYFVLMVSCLLLNIPGRLSAEPDDPREEGEETRVERSAEGGREGRRHTNE